PALLDAGEPAAAIPVARPDTIRRGIKWGGIFLGAFTGLVGLMAGLWVEDFVRSMPARHDWLGWVTVRLPGTACLAAAMLVLREVWALMRLSRLGRLRHAAESAVNHNDRKEAIAAADGVGKLYSGREELAWGRSRLAEHAGDVLDARERLVLTERELL